MLNRTDSEPWDREGVVERERDRTKRLGKDLQSQIDKLQDQKELLQSEGEKYRVSFTHLETWPNVSSSAFNCWVSHKSSLTLYHTCWQSDIDLVNKNNPLISIPFKNSQWDHADCQTQLGYYVDQYIKEFKIRHHENKSVSTLAIRIYVLLYQWINWT